MITADDDCIITVDPHVPPGTKSTRFPVAILEDKRLSGRARIAPIQLHAFDWDMEAMAKHFGRSVKSIKKDIDKVLSLGYKRSDFTTVIEPGYLQ